MKESKRTRKCFFNVTWLTVVLLKKRKKCGVLLCPNGGLPQSKPAENRDALAPKISNLPPDYH